MGRLGEAFSRGLRRVIPPTEGPLLDDDEARALLAGAKISELADDTDDHERDCLVFDMGVRRDPVFGLILAFGFGGRLAGALGETVLRRCPVELDEARGMIASACGAQLLSAAQVDALGWLLVLLSRARGGARARALEPFRLVGAGEEAPVRGQAPGPRENSHGD
ncbi:hypothetical protein D3C78_1517480 [compost metagenome]